MHIHCEIFIAVRQFNIPTAFPQLHRLCGNTSEIPSLSKFSIYNIDPVLSLEQTSINRGLASRVSSQTFLTMYLGIF